MADYLLGIDFGTGGAKVCLIDDELNILAYAFREYPILMPRQGWSEHDPHSYWQYTGEMIQECLQKAGIDPRLIRGIGTSSALPCMVMVDKAHQPIHRAYNLLDRRATREVAWLKEHIGERRIFEVTGNRLEDHPSIVNLMWERNNRPESYRRIHKALTIDGYIRLKLTGKATANYSTAVFYGVAFDILARKFDGQILEEIDIDPALLPDVFSCEAIIGEVTEEAAAYTKLAPGTPVIAGGADCNAGYLGAGAVEEGDIQMNLGTCGNFGIIHKRTDFLNSMIVFPYTIHSGDTYITVPTTTTGGQSIRYLRDNFSPIEVEMEKMLDDLDAYDLLNMEAEKIPLGCGGLVILPYLMGERSPIWDVNARCVIFGLSLSHTKAHLVRAMMEGVAYALYHNFEIIRDADWKINYPIVLNEGGAKSKLWRRIMTDVFNVPTVLVKERAGAPYGNAIHAGVVTGVFPDYGVAREKAEYIEPMEPIAENHEPYMELFAIYKNLYQHVKDDFRDLAQVREKLA